MFSAGMIVAIVFWLALFIGIPLFLFAYVVVRWLRSRNRSSIASAVNPMADMSDDQGQWRYLANAS